MSCGKMLETKVCTKCKIHFPLDNFCKSKKNKSGLATRCKSCEKIRHQKPTETLIFKGARLNTDTQKWCPTCQLLLGKSCFYRNNAQSSGLRSECKSCHNLREIKKRNSDKCYKMRTNISRSIRKMLKGRQKSGSCMSYLPFTLNQLKEHLESKFDINMNWENYGSYWDIDHIYPHSLLPYENMTDQNFLSVWSLENLQPLEKNENIKKSNKIISIR